MTFSPIRRRWLVIASITAAFVLTLYYNSDSRGWLLPNTLPEAEHKQSSITPSHSVSEHVVETTSARKPASTWSSLQQHYPVHSIIHLPPSKLGKIATVQHAFTKDESIKVKDLQSERRNAVREVFEHAWSGYKSRAWLKDEVAPISGAFRNSFGGLAASLVDALDSLWILGFRDEFEEAVKAVADINFSKSEETIVNVFEYTIRYLGGLLGAFEISERKYPVLLEKAIEMGEMLYAAFDTPNGMPITRWNWTSSAEGQRMEAADGCLVAELASLSLEFTTLSRLSKDNKYYDAIQRITDELQKAQNSTKLPGMWPVVVDARTPSFSGGNTFTLGAMSDSLYEYLPKVRLFRVVPFVLRLKSIATPLDEWCNLSIPRDVRKLIESYQRAHSLPPYDSRQ